MCYMMAQNGPLTPATTPTVSFLSGGLRVPSTSAVALVHTIKERLHELLAVHNGNTIANENKTKRLCQYYNTMIPEDRGVFLRMLASDYSVQQGTVIQLASKLSQAQDRGATVLLRAEDRLRHALIPRYQHLFTQISRQENGVKFLVDLQTDLLNMLSNVGVDHDNAHLLSMNTCLRDLLALWFSVGFLHLERITWQSPGDMLQKISQYEAVHPIRNYTDLMRRVGAYRRCYVFTHNSMPREPVVVLHTALTTEISSNIQTIVTRDKFGEDNGKSSTTGEVKEVPEMIKCAIFYSITSTQRGLQGVEMGNYLIKSVVKELLTEFPNMSQFSSLSPIPGFKEWLMREINTFSHLEESGEFPEQSFFLPEELTSLTEVLSCQPRHVFDGLRKTLQNNSWINSPKIVDSLHIPLMRLCARYLYVEKRRGYALNPVANFHLRNGAVMWRLNWLADTSPRGLGAACGMMVNYRYYLDQSEDNSTNYTEKQIISASDDIHRLISQLPAQHAENHISESPASSC